MYINMSVNSSSFNDIPVLPLHLFFSNSSLHLHGICYWSKMSIYALSAISIIKLFLLPLLIFVLYLGFQQGRRQRSTIMAARSHSDVFTFHSITMQLNELLGFALFYFGSFFDHVGMLSVGLCSWSVASLGQALFHLLTCVERYLAICHPITYLRLRQASGVRIRNISIGCVWMISVGSHALLYGMSSKFEVALYICTMSFFLIFTSFCSISVLCALKRPVPGEVGGNRERVDQLKQRAFYTIMAIMGALLFGFAGNMTFSLIDQFSGLSDPCLVWITSFWFDLPSRFVLPLMFLHRAGKLPYCKKDTESGSA